MFEPDDEDLVFIFPNSFLATRNGPSHFSSYKFVIPSISRNILQGQDNEAQNSIGKEVQTRMVNQGEPNTSDNTPSFADELLNEDLISRYCALLRACINGSSTDEARGKVVGVEELANVVQEMKDIQIENEAISEGMKNLICPTCDDCPLIAKEARKLNV